MTRILIIEDMPSLREEIMQAIECLDFDVIGAENGLVGVQLAKEHLPDLIISDIMMPEMDGYGVFKTLQEESITAAIPFIFLTAKTDKADIRYGMNLGVDDYLTKPFTTDELSKAINIRLEKQAERKQAEHKLRESETQFRKLAQREELLNRLTKQIRNSLDLKTILNTALSEIRNLLHIHRCRFLWYRQDVERPYFELIDEYFDPGLENIPNTNPFQEIAALGKAILELNIINADNICSANQLNSESRDRLAAEGFSSLLAISIKTPSGQVGVVACEHFYEPRPWNNDEIELLQAVADQLAIAIDQAELYAKSGFAATAAKIQASQLEKALTELKNAQTQLVHTEKMSSLGQMVAGVAHEINNPVTFISGNVRHVRTYVQDLLDLLSLYQEEYPNSTPRIQEKSEDIELDFLVEDLPKVLSSMEIGADRIREIVLSLRNFSRLDEAEMKPVDIHQGLDNTLLILQNRLKFHADLPRIEVIKEYGKLPLVECYAGQLNQVFMNLLGNAIDAIETALEKGELSINQNQERTPTILIRTKTLGSEFVIVEIKDNGLGMTEQVRKRLFDPFFTTKPVGKGTGLGLSISYQIIVEKHRGTIECISEPGLGTTFSIKIPVGQDETVAKT